MRRLGDSPTKRPFGYFCGSGQKLHAQQGGIKGWEYKAFEWKLLCLDLFWGCWAKAQPTGKGKELKKKPRRAGL